MTPVALTIAGSDPSGGAGVQADLRTFGALGVVGLSVITALTVQNSRGVQSVHPVPADIVAAQLEAILSDTPPNAVKIGMLGGGDQVRVVADALRLFRPPNVVLDPVLASTSGVPLLDEAGRRLLIDELLPLCDLVTPNLAEATALTGLPVSDVDEMLPALHTLIDKGVGGAVIKGGHLAGPPIDAMAVRGEPICERTYRERIDTPHTHGTGCALSAAIAAQFALGRPPFAAYDAARKMLQMGLKAPVVVGQGRGYPDMAAAGRAFFDRDDRTHAERLALLRGIYVVTDSDLAPGRTHAEIAQAAYAGGACAVQLRDKHLSTPALLTAARDVGRVLPAPVSVRGVRQGAENASSEGRDVLFLVNDRLDIALAHPCDGVHLGPDDMHPNDARRLLGPDKLIGVSVSSVREARVAAQWKVSYLGVGAIFGSKTKKDAGKAIGVERIRAIKRALPHFPIVAIGGINTDNIAEVAAAGADAAAVVSAVVTAPDMTLATRDLCRRFEAAR